MRLIVQRDGSADRQPGVLADELQVLDADDVLIEREPDRRRVSHRVVEQPHVEAVDGGVDQQTIDVGQLADDSNRAAGDGGREGRQLRHEQTDVRIERAVVEPERQLGVGLRRQRHAAGAGDRQPRRRRIDFAAQLVAAKRERPGHLPDALLRDEQIVDAEPDVVARNVERAASTGGELDETRRA